MGKITGLERPEDVPPKVLKMYRAVLELIEEGADTAGFRVSTVTDRAGIGKGTAYEYFETKEEIVACAVVNYLQQLFGSLRQILSGIGTFEGQLDFLLNEMEKQDGRKFCFLRFVHILTDNSEFSKSVQQKIESEEFTYYRPLVVFSELIQQAVDRGELREDLPVEYMVYSVFSHLVTYIMALTSEENHKLSAEKLRPFVKQGILDELCKKNVQKE